jgi:branched-chain amino acid transport system permease protein
LTGFGLLLVLAPVFLNDYLLSWIIVTGIVIISVQGLNVLTGYAGQISVGQAAFMAVGAYTSAILTAKAGVPFIVGLPLGGIVAGAIGLVFGVPSLRMKGFYLALTTLGAQFIIIYVLQHIPITGESYGMTCPPASIGGLIFNTRVKFYYLVIVIITIMTLIAKNIARTKFGRALVAVRDNDISAEVLGINVYYYKLLAFFTGCFFAGIAGVLWAHYTTSIHPDHFPFYNSILYLGMLIIGGMGSTFGAIVGPILMRALEEGVGRLMPMLADAFPAYGTNIFPALGPMVFGALIAAFLIFEPRGIAHRWEMLKASYRLWPFAY